MKASLKFREDQQPLVRAKIPVSILGLPFLSGISAGDAKELSLSLGTFFESGPSLKLSYRPNDSWNPFSLVLRTGIGSFGSPISAPMAMSAEFSLLGRGNPSFFLQFKPQIGDFSIKKTAGSAIPLPSKTLVFGKQIKLYENNDHVDGDGSVDGDETPRENGSFSGQKANGFHPDLSIASGIENLFSDVELSAKSVFPLRNRALLKFRWGIRSPKEPQSFFNSTAGISFGKTPLLFMNKISIEHVAEERNDSGQASKSSVTKLERGAGASDACVSVKRQIEVLQAENGLLRKALEEQWSEIGTKKSFPISGNQIPGQYKKTTDENNGKSGLRKGETRGENKSPGSDNSGDVSEELKKSLMGGSVAGI